LSSSHPPPAQAIFYCMLTMINLLPDVGIVNTSEIKEYIVGLTNCHGRVNVITKRIKQFIFLLFNQL
jgi:hypothetical protein